MYTKNEFFDIYNYVALFEINKYYFNNLKYF
jgi:hypothetical protein